MHGNSTTFIGNVAQEPRSVNGGKSVKLSIAWNERPKPDGTKGRTVFMDVFVNGKLGEHVLASVSSGERVVVIGSVSSYLDKNHNISRHSITAEVVAKSLEFGAVGSANREASTDDYMDDDDDGAAEEPAPATPPRGRTSRVSAKPKPVERNEDDAAF